MKKFNARIEDKHFHELHHALGRPWPEEIFEDTQRNYFAAETESSTVDRMRASSHWTIGTERNGMVYFHVTDEGKRALAGYLRDNVSVPTRYAIEYRHHNGRSIVVAKSRSSAKYAAYVDADIDWPFLEFAREIKSVRRYTPTAAF